MTLAWRTQPCLQRPLFFYVRKIEHCSAVVAAVASPSEQVKLPKTGRRGGRGNCLPLTSLPKENARNGDRKLPEWKKFDSTQLGISNSMIARPTRFVLNTLKKKGYEVYLVGGCVRDLFLKRIPKDFDIITSAELKEVRTIIAANLSFMEDSVAVRLGFHFTREIAVSLKQLSHYVQKLDKGRILMEINYMLAYGSAEASLRLLWRFGLLEILLPIQASYFASQGFQRQDERSNMLLSLFSNLDKLVSTDHPCHPSLWVGIFAFHKALVHQPRDPQVVAAFAHVVHSGGSLLKSVKLGRSMFQSHNGSFHELNSQDIVSNDVLMDQVVNLAAFVKTAVSKMADVCYVSRAVTKYPQAPCSDMVFIPMALLVRVQKIFDRVRRGKEIGIISEPGNKIDYESLAVGTLEEVRRVFARIVFDTVYPLKKQRSEKTFVTPKNS